VTSGADRPGLKGRFITFEGIDGCGKTAQVGPLAQRMRSAGLTVLETREPGGTHIGVGLRALLLDPANRVLTPQAEVLLYLADRIQHLQEVIRPALARGEAVVCDRFHDATLAYQQHGRGLDLSALEPFLEREVTPRPDLTFWLDVDVATARKRLSERRAAGGTAAESRIDEDAPDFHQRVREGYQALARLHPERIARIDAQPGVEAVRNAVWTELTRRFNVG
jgi:dTMP kinase